MRAWLLVVVAVLACTEEKPASSKPNAHELALKKRIDEQRGVPPAPDPAPVSKAQPAEVPVPVPAAPARVRREDAPRLGDFADYELGRFMEKTPLRLQVVEVNDASTFVQVSSPRLRWLKDGIVFRLDVGGSAPPPPRSPPEDALSVVTIGAAKFSCHRYRFDESPGDGPSGSGCWHSPDPALRVSGGIVEQEESPSGFGGGDATGYSLKLVGAGNAPLPARGVLAYPPGSFWTRRTEGNSYVERTRVSVTSANGVLVKRYQSSSEAEKGKDGQVYSETLLEHLALLANQLRAQVPPDAKPGPTVTSGPQPVETIKLTFKIARRGVGLMGGSDTQEVLLAAAPEKLVDAPLPVRFGELESVTNRAKGGMYIEGVYIERIVEWKGAR